ncbi:MAG: hypothetical protein KF680_06720 [Cryobacterium sp.]|nr:hypothetical protein [Cryobacterium sp.]
MTRPPHPSLRSPRFRVVIAMAAMATVVMTACSPSDSSPEPDSSSTSAPLTPPALAPPDDDHEWPTEFNAELHDELVAMLERDQIDSMGGSSGESFQTRTNRLSEIIAEFGWPTIVLVGKDGEDAAWAIAQHSDLDPHFQDFALAWLRAAAEAGEASLGNLAYLEDRVLVARGEPQLWGTQIRCGEDGPVPATPIAEEATVDERRTRAGLDPLAVYLDEVAGLCEEFAP